MELVFQVIIGESSVQVGITSFGEGCALPGKPGIYTRLAYYRAWIDSIALDINPTTTTTTPTATSRPTRYPCDHVSAPCGCGYDDVELSRARIVGGEEAVPFSWSMIVSLRSTFTNRHFCGGSILDNYHILTAAHCVDGETPDGISVLAGVHNQVKDDGSLRDVDEIYIHPNWSPFSSENRNDIAILHLSTPLDFVNNPLVRRTCVPHVQWPTNVVEYPVNRTRLAVIGWGDTRTSTIGSSPENLRQAEVLLIHHTDPICNRSLYDIERQFCAALDEGGKGKCYAIHFSIVNYLYSD